MTAPPLFVLGVRRSGTTLLRVMLDRNPAIAIPDESYFIPQLVHRHGGKTVDAEAFLDDVRRLSTLREWGLPASAVGERLRPGMTPGEAIGAIFAAYAGLQSSARSLLENASLIRKVRFPRQLVPLSIVATQLVAFAVMTAIVLVLAMIVLPDSRSTAWLAIPIGAVIVLFVSGLSLAVASANAIYRDIEFVISALLLPLFFLTPVLYSLDDLPVAETHPWLVDLIQWGNPVTPVVECFRAPLFLGEVPSTANLVYLLVETVVALAVGAAVFTAVDDRIAAEL